MNNVFETEYEVEEGGTITAKVGLLKARGSAREGDCRLEPHRDVTWHASQAPSGLTATIALLSCIIQYTRQPE